MANFHTRTIPLHVAVCRVCGKAYQSTDADHVSEWIQGHDQTTCTPVGVPPIPDRDWDE